MRLISRFASSALDESKAPNQRVKFFKELARLRASEPPKIQGREASERDVRLSEPRSPAKE
jgi:hypothetical protein